MTATNSKFKLTKAQFAVWQTLCTETDAKVKGCYITNRWRLMHQSGGLQPTSIVRWSILEKLIEVGLIVRADDERGRRVYVATPNTAES